MNLPPIATVRPVENPLLPLAEQLLRPVAQAAAQPGFPPLDVSVYLITGDSKKLISQFRTPASPTGENSASGTFESEIEKDIPERFSVQLVCDSCPEYNSEYCFVHNLKETYLPGKKSAASFKEDFSDFLR